MRLLIAIPILMFLMFGITACAPESGMGTEPSDSVGSGFATKEGNGESESRLSDAQAVISVASVDADGLHATASGFIIQIMQEDLTCTFSFTQGDLIVVRETKTVIDRSGSSCGQVTVPTSDLTRGSWKIVLTITGSDEPVIPTTVIMEVP